MPSISSNVQFNSVITPTMSLHTYSSNVMMKKSPTDTANGAFAIVRSISSRSYSMVANGASSALDSKQNRFTISKFSAQLNRSMFY